MRNIISECGLRSHETGVLKSLSSSFLSKAALNFVVDPSLCVLNTKCLHA